MHRNDFWTSDWFLGVLVAAVVLALVPTDLAKSLERKAYDLGARASNRAPDDKIVVIAIDDNSIANIGRWPWPRDIPAQMIDRLSAAHAKVVGYSVFFPDPDVNPVRPYIEQLPQLYSQLPASEQAQFSAFATVLKTADRKFATDRRLAESVSAAGNVALPMLFRVGQLVGEPDQAAPEGLRKNSSQSSSLSKITYASTSAELDTPILDRLASGAASIVLVGPTVAGITNVFATPVTSINVEMMPAVLMNAHAVSSIFQEGFFVAPAWSSSVSALAFVLAACYVIFLLPRLGSRIGTATTIALLGILLTAHLMLMTRQLMWLQLMSAASMLVLGHLVLTTKRFLAAESGGNQSDLNSTESNRALGLALQVQGAAGHGVR